MAPRIPEEAGLRRHIPPEIEGGPLTFEERYAYEHYHGGDLDRALEAAAIHDRRTPKGKWDRALEERMRGPRPKSDGGGVGLTEKEFTLLSHLWLEGEGVDGLSARDLEPGIARSLGRNFIGWAASDLTVSLHRMAARGLVRREERLRVYIRDPKWVWFITEAGESAAGCWLDLKGY